jgi:hypothetical protein
MPDSPGVRLRIVDTTGATVLERSRLSPAAAFDDQLDHQAEDRIDDRSENRRLRRTARASPLSRSAARLRRYALLAFVLLLAYAGALTELGRAVQLKAISGSGTVAATVFMGPCPTGRTCAITDQPSVNMYLAIQTWFPEYDIAASSGLFDSRNGQTYAQRVVLTHDDVHVVLSASAGPGSLAREMQFALSAIQGHVIVTASPIDSAQNRGASVSMYSTAGSPLPIQGAESWATTLDLFG